MNGREPRVSINAHYNDERGHALVSFWIYEGAHGYITIAAALTLDGVVGLRAKLAEVESEMRAAAMPAKESV